MAGQSPAEEQPGTLKGGTPEDSPWAAARPRGAQGARCGHTEHQRASVRSARLTGGEWTGVTSACGDPHRGPGGDSRKEGPRQLLCF